jgi:hypothetical protein
MGLNHGVSTNWANQSRQNSLVGLIPTNLTYAIDFARPLSFTSGSSTAYDLQGNVNSTLNNGPIFRSDHLGYMSFDGTNDFFSMQDSVTGNTSTPVLLSTVCSVYFWIRTTSSAQMGFFSHWSGGPVNVGYGLNGGKLYYLQYDGQWNYYTSTGASVNTGTWQHLAFIRSSATTMTMYVNGVQDYVLTVSSPRVLGGGNMGSVGVFWGWGYYSGDMGSMQVYNDVAHTASQVNVQYKAHRNRYNVI